eukprot:gene2526-3266_t
MGCIPGLNKVCGICAPLVDRVIEDRLPPWLMISCRWLATFGRVFMKIFGTCCVCVASVLINGAPAPVPLSMAPTSTRPTVPCPAYPQQPARRASRRAAPCPPGANQPPTASLPRPPSRPVPVPDPRVLGFLLTLLAAYLSFNLIFNYWLCVWTHPGFPPK